MISGKHKVLCNSTGAAFANAWVIPVSNFAKAGLSAKILAAYWLLEGWGSVYPSKLGTFWDFNLMGSNQGEGEQHLETQIGNGILKSKLGFPLP